VLPVAKKAKWNIDRKLLLVSIIIMAVTLYVQWEGTPPPSTLLRNLTAIFRNDARYNTGMIQGDTFSLNGNTYQVVISPNNRFGLENSQTGMSIIIPIYSSIGQPFQIRGTNVIWVHTRHESSLFNIDTYRYVFSIHPNAYLGEEFAEAGRIYRFFTVNGQAGRFDVTDLNNVRVVGDVQPLP